MATSMFDKLRQMNSTTPTAQLMQKTAEQQRKEKAAATGTPYKTSTTTAPTLQSSDPVYTGKVSSSYVPGSLGNQKVGTSSGGGGTTPPLTPDPPIPPTGGGSGDSGATQAYLDALAALEEQKRQQEEAQRIRTRATVDSINSNIPQINQDYENQQAGNYIQHTKDVYGLSDYLRAQGLSGGMTETKATELQTGYENNRNATDQSKNSALDNIRNLIAQAQATGDESLSKIATDYYNNYRQTLEAQAAAEQNQYQFNATQASAEQLRQDNLNQNAISNDLATKEYQRAVANDNKKTTGGGSGGTKYSVDDISYMIDNGWITDEQGKSMLGISSTTPTAPTQQSAGYQDLVSKISGMSNYLGRKAWIQYYNQNGKITDAEAQALLSQYVQ